MKKPSRFPEVAIVGMGLIGGSLALALRRVGVRVTGIDLNTASIKRARKAGAVMRGTTSIREGVKGAGIIVLCVPLRKFGKCIAGVSRHASTRAVVTDVSSVKKPILESAQKNLDRIERFVGGHPLAGSEKSGFPAARADLFKNRICVLTSSGNTGSSALRIVGSMWKLAGSTVVRMNAERHDAAVARTSHLPHAIAGALVQLILKRKGLAPLVSGSFLDATRVAISSADLWRDILIANRREVRCAIRDFSRELERLGRAIERADGTGIGEILSRGRRMRRKFDRGRTQ